MTKEQQYEIFMRASNAIEGELEPGFVEINGRQRTEGRLNPGDIEACTAFLKLKKITLKDILTVHSVLARYLNVPWSGKLRDCNVRVGKYIAPDWKLIPKLASEFIEKLPSMYSWEAHNAYEKLHIFQDLNGRTGRLIWLWKARQEGYKFDLPFLQAYYYQTLEFYENNI